MSVRGDSQKNVKHIATLGLAMVLAVPVFAQTNTQDNADTQHQLKKNEKAHKTQAKAQRKALNTHAQRKADAKQDEANRAADKAADPAK